MGIRKYARSFISFRRVKGLAVFVSPLLVWASSSQAQNSLGVHVAGRITDLSGTALTSNNVDFTLRVLSPLGCVLYSEHFAGRDMTGTNGEFKFALGTGGSATNAYDSGTPQDPSSFRKVFDNSASSLTGLNAATAGACAGGTYSPAAGDVRLVLVEFDAHDAAGPQKLLPAYTIRQTPHALVAEEAFDAKQLGGVAANNYLVRANLPTCANGEVLKYDGTNLICVTDATGGSPLVATTSSLGVMQVGAGLNVSSGVVSVQNPSSGDLTGTFPNLTVAKIRGTAVSATSPTAAGQVLRYDGASSYAPGFLSMADIRSTVTPANTIFPTSACSASQALSWSSLTDSFTCQNVAVSSTQVTGLGTAAALDAGASAGNVPVLDGSGKLASGVLPSTLGQWATGASSSINYTAGNVGIGTTGPTRSLDVAGNQSVTGYLRVGSSSNPVNTTAGDLTATRLSVGNGTLGSSGLGVIAALSGTSTDTASGSVVGTGLTMTLSPSASSASTFRSLNMSNMLNSSANFTASGSNGISAGWFENRVVNAGTINTANGLTSNGLLIGSAGTTLGTVSTVNGGLFIGVNSFSNALTSTIQNVHGMQVLDNSNSGTGPLVINNSAGVTIQEQTKGSSNSNLLIGTSSIPTGNYAVYNASTRNNYFGGNVGIGTTAPGTALDLNGALSVRGMAAPAVSPAGQGRIYFDSTSNQFMASENGGAYTALISAGGAGSQASSSTFSFNSNSDATGTDGGFNFKANGTNLLTIANNGDTAMTSTTASTSASTGALKVAGGLGVSGDIYAGATVNAATSMSTPQIYGSSAASGTLKLDGTSNVTKGNVLINSAGGNVGIGTSLPNAILQVAGNLSSVYSGGGVNGANRIWLTNSDTTNNNYADMAFATNDLSSTMTTAASIASVFTSHASGAVNGDLAFRVRNAGTLGEAIRIQSTGNVGIGTTSPSNKLTIVDSDANPALSLTNSSSTTARYPQIFVQNYSGGNGGAPVFGLFSSRGSAASPSALQSGDSIGLIIGYGHDGTTTLESSRIALAADENFGSSARGGRIAFSTVTAGTTTETERMRITSSGNVGIGVTSPTALLHLKAGGSAASSSPLKFTSGSLLSTVENGAMEYDGTSFYLTTGGSRSIIATGGAAGAANLANITSTSSVTVTPSAGNSLIVNSATASTSPSSGALIVSGGAGIANALNVGGAITSNGAISATTATAATSGANSSSPSIYLTAKYWNGSSSQLDQFSITNMLGTGSNPTATLAFDHSGTSGSSSYTFSNGNVGIGTTTPAYALDVYGGTNGLQIQQGGGARIMRIDGQGMSFNTTATFGQNTYGGIAMVENYNYFSVPARVGYFFKGVSGQSGDAFRYVDSSNVLLTSITASGGAYHAGNVGIGTTSPQTALDVGTGKISGGTNSATRRPVLDLSASSTSDQVNFWFPNSHGTFDIIAGISRIGTNDIFFQATPPAAGYTIFEGYSGAGLALSTGGAATPIIFTPNRVEAMRISGTGNVGIGTTNPTDTLASNGNIALIGANRQFNARNGDVSSIMNFDFPEIATSSAAVRFFRNTTTSSSSVNLQIYKGDGTGTLNTVLAGGATSSYINALGGNVGIGTTSPSALLDVKGMVSIAPTGTTNDNGYNGGVAITKPAASGQYINLIRASTVPWSIGMVYNTSDFAIGGGQTTDSNFTSPYFVIRSNGSVGIGTTSPGVKLEVADSANVGMRVRTTGGTPSDLTFSSQTSGMSFIGSMLTSTPVGFITGNTERMRIDTSGNVGIGTTNPSYKLDVTAFDQDTRIAVQNFNSTVARYPGFVFSNYMGAANAGSPVLLMYNRRGTGGAPAAVQSGDTLGLVQFSGGSDSAYGVLAGASVAAFAEQNFSASAAGTALVLQTTSVGGTYPTEKLRVTANGNVGIGLYPSYKLDVSGGVNASGGYTQVSDIRLKTHIENLDSREALEKITSLRGIYYDWKDPARFGADHQVGLVAQDVQKVFPEAVKTNSEGFLSVSYSNLVAPVIEAIKALLKTSDQQAREIASVRSKVDQLEAENASLKSSEAAKEKKIRDLERRLEGLERRIDARAGSFR